MSKSGNTRWYWCLGVALVLLGTGGVIFFVLKEHAREQAEREAEERRAREAEERQALRELRFKLIEIEGQRRLAERQLAAAKAELGNPQRDAQIKLKVIQLEGELHKAVALREGLLRGLHVVEDGNGRIIRVRQR